MAPGIVQDTRTVRAAGIRDRQELLMRDDGTWQVRDTAGSGKWHTILDQHCTCPDYVYRHMTCKHLRAVAAEERSLAQYGATWDARADQQRTSVTPMAQAGTSCPDCGSATSPDNLYIGGTYRLVGICRRNREHQAVRA